MRKDLKIGMAIGAVLLVVLVVYFAMPKPEEGGGGDVADAGGTAVATTDGAAVSGDPVPPAAEATPSARAQEDAAGADAADSSVANAGKAKRDVFAPDADATAGDEADDADDSAEGDGGGTNWAKLLEMGDSGDIVRTETPATPSADATKASGTDAGTSIPRLAASRRESNDDDAPTASPTPGGVSAGPAADSTASASPTAADAGTSSATTPPSDSAASAAVTPAAPSATGARTHKVKAGENYSTIAKAVYGHSRYYLAIEKANPDIDPTRIRPGTEIKLPDPATVKGSASSSTVGASAEDADAEPRAIDPNTEYRVKPNDSLHKIAIARYGNSTMADKIYELNQQTIGSDPAKLKLGMILKLPPGAKKDETVASEQ